MVRLEFHTEPRIIARLTVTRVEPESILNCFYRIVLFSSDSYTRLPRIREELRVTDVSELRVVS